MSDRLTVILPPALSVKERERAALDLCNGSLIVGDGYGDGNGDGRGCGEGDGWGASRCGGWGGGWGWGNGDGESATHV